MFEIDTMYLFFIAFAVIDYMLEKISNKLRELIILQ